MKFVSEIFKLTWNCVRDSICRNLCSEFVNSFARRQHLFEIVAKPIYVDSSFLSYRAACSCSTVNINLFVVVLTSHKFHQNPFSILAKRKYIYIYIFVTGRNTGRTEDGTEAAKDKVKTYYLRSQRRLWRHKNIRVTVTEENIYNIGTVSIIHTYHMFA